MKKNKIYTLWWQGIENAPSIIKLCHRSLLKNYNSETQEIILLDKNNVFEYVQLPNYILDKFYEGRITITHLSDVIRSVLLAETGGLWSDATMFYVQPLSDDLFKKDFFTLKNPISNPKDITSKWECFFIGGEPNFPLFELLRDFWFEYWKKEDDLITYLLTDHIFYIAYMENERVRHAIDSCESFHYRIDYFQRLLNKPFNEKDYREIIKNEPYIKLSYKFPLSKKNDKGIDTYYGHLLKEFLCSGK